MGTRVGNIDANAVLYLEKKLNVTPDEMSVILNRKSGFLGVSTKSSDARDLDELANNGDPKAKLVFKKFTYDIIKNIGSYVAAMNGVDLIVFTGGIGEHNSRLRRRAYGVSVFAVVNIVDILRLQLVAEVIDFMLDIEGTVYIEGFLAAPHQLIHLRTPLF